MQFQNLEFYETDKFQYLLIQKNGSSSVTACVDPLNPVVTNRINFRKIRWTVIRDPYERFISGLNYDLKIHNLNIEDVDPSTFYHAVVNVDSRKRGRINHSTSQIPYIINSHINWYVELKDLSTFLKMHFNNAPYRNKQENKIQLNLDKEEIMKHLELDYYIYNQILVSSALWKWQQGKIF